MLEIVVRCYKDNSLSYNTSSLNFALWLRAAALYLVCFIFLCIHIWKYISKYLHNMSVIDRIEQQTIQFPPLCFIVNNTPNIWGCRFDLMSPHSSNFIRSEQIELTFMAEEYLSPVCRGPSFMFGMLDNSDRHILLERSFTGHCETIFLSKSTFNSFYIYW